MEQWITNCISLRLKNMAGLQHLMFCSSPLTLAWCCVQRLLHCMKNVLICAGFTNKFLEERMRQQSTATAKIISNAKSLEPCHRVGYGRDLSCLLPIFLRLKSNNKHHVWKDSFERIYSKFYKPKQTITTTKSNVLMLPHQYNNQ